MKYTNNALNILTALSYKGIGKAWIVKKLKGNESIETIVVYLNETIKETTDIAEFEGKRKGFEATILSKFESCCDGFVALGDKEFPQYRGKVKDSDGCE